MDHLTIPDEIVVPEHLFRFRDCHAPNFFNPSVWECLLPSGLFGVRLRDRRQDILFFHISYRLDNLLLRQTWSC